MVFVLFLLFVVVVLFFKFLEDDEFLVWFLVLVGVSFLVEFVVFFFMLVVFKCRGLGLVVVDFLYWRDIKKIGVVFGVSLFLLLFLIVFSIVSVMVYIVLVLFFVIISFRIYKGVI